MRHGNGTHPAQEEAILPPAGEQPRGIRDADEHRYPAERVCLWACPQRFSQGELMFCPRAKVRERGATPHHGVDEPTAPAASCGPAVHCALRGAAQLLQTRLCRVCELCRARRRRRRVGAPPAPARQGVRRAERGAQEDVQGESGDGGSGALRVSRMQHQSGVDDSSMERSRRTDRQSLRGRPSRG